MHGRRFSSHLSTKRGHDQSSPYVIKLWSGQALYIMLKSAFLMPPAGLLELSIHTYPPGANSCNPVRHNAHTSGKPAFSSWARPPPAATLLPDDKNTSLQKYEQLVEKWHNGKLKSSMAWENLGCSEFFENRWQVVLVES